MSKKRHEFITLLLVIVFGFAGAWLMEIYGTTGEDLAVFFAAPPAAYYLRSVWKSNHSREKP